MSMGERRSLFNCFSVWVCTSTLFAVLNFRFCTVLATDVDLELAALKLLVRSHQEEVEEHVAGGHAKIQGTRALRTNVMCPLTSFLL